jgi:hypothetical protein
MEWKIASIILIALLIGVGIGYAVSLMMYERDYSGHLDSIERQLDDILIQLSQVNQTLTILSQLNQTITALALEPTYTVISITQNFSWANPNTAVIFYDINCTKFSHMFVYLTIDKMNPPTGSTTTFWLTQIVWHLYPYSSQDEWTWSRQAVAPETLNLTAYAYNNFNGTDTASQGGAQFTTIGQYADLTFAFNSTAPTGWVLLTCSIYLRNE